MIMFVNITCQVLKERLILVDNCG